MARQQRRAHRPAMIAVQIRREPLHGLRCVAEPVDQQRGVSLAAIERDRFGTGNDAERSGGQARGLGCPGM